MQVPLLTTFKQIKEPYSHVTLVSDFLKFHVQWRKMSYISLKFILKQILKLSTTDRNHFESRNLEAQNHLEPRNLEA